MFENDGDPSFGMQEELRLEMAGAAVDEVWTAELAEHSSTVSLHFRFRGTKPQLEIFIQLGA
jgi:hypothetical protein